LESLKKAGLLEEFFDSFFVIASGLSDHSLLPENFLGAIFALDRRPNFQTKTVFLQASSGVIKTKKTRLYPTQNYVKHSDTLQLHELDYNWIDGPSLHSLLVKELCKNQNKSFFARVDPLIQNWLAIVMHRFDDANQSLSSDSIDCIWKNTILDPKTGQLEFIDLEWSTNKVIDINWIIFRAVYDFSLQEASFAHRWRINEQLLSPYQIMRHISSQHITKKFSLIESAKSEQWFLKTAKDEHHSKLIIILYSVMPIRWLSTYKRFRSFFSRKLQTAFNLVDSRLSRS
jgi:hypothetical protein